MNDVPPTELTQSPATTFGHEVDALFYTMLGLSGLLVAVLIVLIVTFCVRFHRLRDTDRDRRPPGWLEYLWTAIPLAIFMGLFVWGATLFLDIGRVPADALEIRAVAKQWMWKFYHPNGRREINELHLPVDRPIRIVLSSEDVIHSFYVPGFRIKQDALPGRFTRTWFEVDRTGTYRLFCAEYCGTAHSRMRGTVRVLEQAEYGDWLAAGDAAPGEVSGHFHPKAMLALRGRRIRRRWPGTTRCSTATSPTPTNGG